MNDEQYQHIVDRIEKVFRKEGIKCEDIAFRRFPGELIVVVSVFPSDYKQAILAIDDVDTDDFDGFITVKKAEKKHESKPRKIESIVDRRITALIETLNSKSRTSESQPSLHYVRDAAENLSISLTHRHHLIFGRRGVGKTALMVEAKASVEAEGEDTFWLNLQTVRGLSAIDAFLATCQRMCDLPEVIFQARRSFPQSVKVASRLRRRIEKALEVNSEKERSAQVIVSEMQQLIRTVTQETQGHLYIFLDDIHYLSRKELPAYLDMMHGITRDNQCWLKVAGIRHQSKWWTDNPPTGLQTGHDASIIDLDITLEEPNKAKDLLVKILESYVVDAGIPSLGAFIVGPAVDRLVLASGGVPRDFLVLTASAIQSARERTNARFAGVQDVNEAAGSLSKLKIQELEDDAAAEIEGAQSVAKALNIVRSFLLDEQQITYFRVDFRDKEQQSREYNLLQSLMDLRLVHILNSSLSDKREAGRRSEVYMLDLSQFSGSRLKQNLRVLDFTKGHLVSKRTRSREAPKLGDTPKKLQTILRGAPLFELKRLMLDH